MSALEIRENLLLIFLVATTMARHVIQGAAAEPWGFYLGALIDVQDFYSLVVTRALISTCAPKYELGKVLALYSCMEGLLPIGVTQAFASVWQVHKNGSFKITVAM